LPFRYPRVYQRASVRAGPNGNAVTLLDLKVFEDLMKRHLQIVSVVLAWFAVTLAIEKPPPVRKIPFTTSVHSLKALSSLTPTDPNETERTHHHLQKTQAIHGMSPSPTTLEPCPTTDIPIRPEEESDVDGHFLIPGDRTLRWESRENDKSKRGFCGRNEMEFLVPKLSSRAPEGGQTQANYDGL
ncbi:hypothetical protein C0991_008029, partial [Blastosporella zonata]